ncbi:MAG: hypothetical protein HRT71_14480 [Flavobacteriales bacterium]|nr:hypothetical protein [Flavobacteriales bacterium]
MNLIFKRFFIIALAVICAASEGIAQDRLPCIDNSFTILMHVFLDKEGVSPFDEADINNTIAALNTIFEPICASFNVCEYVYHPNWNYQVHNSDSDWVDIQVLYNRDNVINVYFVTDIDMPENVGGYAFGSITTAIGGGILVLDPGVLIHEMGHYFGLRHTFAGNGIENVDGSNCTTAGDLICDTPADPFVKDDAQTDYHNNCIFDNVAKTDANGEYYSPYINNVMSYYNGCSPEEFTHGQYQRMADTYLANRTTW